MAIDNEMIFGFIIGIILVSFYYNIKQIIKWFKDNI